MKFSAQNLLKQILLDKIAKTILCKAILLKQNCALEPPSINARRPPPLKAAAIIGVAPRF